ncbi:MAG TPA: hypothetical protein VK050_11545 [Flavobacteriaceae bacterium]|nr:hypothetical protein [Flavobacteriaceae bacterium]
MRNILFFCLTVLIWIPSTAQEKKNEKSKYYISSEVGAGNYMSYGADLNYILNDKFSFRLGYSGHVRNSKELPYNLTSTVSTPRDVMNTFQFMVGHAVYLNPKNKKSRVNFAAGIGYTSIDKPTNWEVYNPESDKGQVVYIYDKNTEQEASLIIQPKIEFLIERYFGFTVSPTLQISEHETYIGIGFGSMIGNL